jgi:hypothetical protein
MASASAYLLTGKKLNKDWTGQKKLVVEAFLSTPEPLTVSEIANFLDSHPKFNTVQSSERIAAYYVCILNKEGYISRASEKENAEMPISELEKIRDFYLSKADAVIERIENARLAQAELVTEEN